MLSALEVHYYDGGLRVATFPERRRLSALPAEDSIVFENIKPLTRTEVVFEVAVINSASNVAFLWVGCYLPSIDRQFGDRANYVCVGLWFDGMVALECKDLLFSLYQAATVLNKQGLTKALSEKLTQLSTVISESYLHSRDIFPPICAGLLPFASSQKLVREFQLNDSIENAAGALESALINLQLAPKPFVDVPRVRFRIVMEQGSTSISDALPSQRDLLYPIVTGLPKIVERTATELTEIKKTVSVLVAERSKANREMSELSQINKEIVEERDSQKKKLLEQEEELDRLRKLPYTIINTQLKELSSRIDRALSPNRGNGAYISQPRPLSPAAKNAHPKSDGSASTYVAYVLGFAVIVLIGVGAAYLIWRLLP